MTEYIFDMDETICTTKNQDPGHKSYFLDNMIPHKKMIRAINKLYDSGHRITIMTGRGATTGLNWVTETELQLRTWGVKYHELKFIKKPLDYLYVDDKAMSPKEFMEKY